MADNVAITAGAGTTIAADDIGAGLLVQRVKVTWGPDGTANDVDAASGKALPAQGDVAHDSADINSPLKIGTKAVAALSAQTLVTANDRANAFGDLDGAVLTRPQTTLGDIVTGTASNTDGTSTEVLAAAAANIYHHLTDVSLDNQSSTDIYVELKSGTTVKWHFGLPAKSSHSKHFDPPLRGGATAEAWNFDPSAAATTVYCSVNGFKSKV